MSKLNKISPIDSTKTGRTSHDMSHGLKFTVAAGHINPVEHDILLAGDTVYHGFDFIARNHVPFVSPAALSLDFHVDYFFVPMELLYKPFSSFVYGINDEWSSLFSDPTDISLPCLNMKALYAAAFENRKHHFNPTGHYPETQVGGAPRECFGKQFLRLMGLLGFPDYFTTNQFMLDSEHCDADAHLISKEIPSVFPYAFLAYKCIYEYYFRDEEREVFENSIFNFDKYYTQNLVDLSDYIQNATAFGINYRNAYKDYFTACRRSPLINERNLMDRASDLTKVFDDLGVSDVELTGNNFADNDNPSNLSYAGAPLSVMQKRSVDQVDGYDTSNYARTTDQYRKLFAVEKLLMVTQAARKNYDAQTLAHFGFKVPHDARHQISHIGHELVTMDVREITAMAGSDGTSGTGNVQFGDYAGKGTCALNAKGIKFTAPCHGVLLTTLSVVPRYDYFTDFLKKNLIQTRLSLFQPEFDHLGMQPLYAFEAELPTSLNAADYEGMSDVYRFIPKSAKDIILGWQYRYEEKKRQFNRTTSAFFFDSDLQSWTISRIPFDRLLAGIEYNPRAVSPQTAWSVDPSSYYLDSVYPVKVHPWDTDNLFLAKYETEWPSQLLQPEEGDNVVYELYCANPAKMYDSDPFVVFGRSRYKKVSIMSTYSMPKLD